MGAITLTQQWLCTCVVLEKFYTYLLGRLHSSLAHFWSTNSNTVRSMVGHICGKILSIPTLTKMLLFKVVNQMPPETYKVGNSHHGDLKYMSLENESVSNSLLKKTGLHSLTTVEGRFRTTLSEAKFTFCICLCRRVSECLYCWEHLHVWQQRARLT